MLFSSPEFLLLFLPLTVAGFALCLRGPKRLPAVWLVLASLFFYGWWNPAHLPLLLGSMLFNLLWGKLLVRQRSRGLLAVGIAVNLGLLGVYKYSAFFLNASGGSTAFQLGDIALPLAISFFTFHQIAYLVDARAGRLTPHDWLDYFLFITFFPQLIAGPIVRQYEMLPQMVGRQWSLRGKQVCVGATLFIAGLCKKLYFADGVTDLVDPVFDAARLGQPVYVLEAWAAAIGFSLQIYFDFSGYSDMAMGLSQIFGLKLPRNFNSPYQADSIIDFWRRWHMSLSRFLRDYLYIPLGGNRHGRAVMLINLMVVMALGGLWHGAGWTFVAWGALHGGFLLINHLWRDLKDRLGWRPEGTVPARMASRVLTLLCVLLAWILFRAETLEVAGTMLRAMLLPPEGLALPLAYQGKLAPLMPVLQVVGGHFADIAQKSLAPLSVAIPGLLVALALPNSTAWLAGWSPTLERIPPLSGRWRPLRWRPHLPFAILVAIMLILANTVIWSQNGGARQFIYFQF